MRSFTSPLVAASSAAIVMVGGLFAGASAAPVAVGHGQVAESHLVTPGKGVTGAFVGDTAGQVEHNFGKPTSGEDDCAGSSTDCFTWYFEKTGRTLGFKLNKQGDIKSATLLYIEFSKDSDQTKSGIGIGTPRKTVEKLYPDCPSSDEFCFLSGKGTGTNPKNGQRYTYVFFGDKGKEAVQTFIVGEYESKYESCVFGCG